MLSGSKTTSTDICRWAQALFLLHERIATRFARLEPRRRVLSYLQGILSETARKNGWQLAEFAGEEHPHGMQRLLSQAVWDTHGVRDDVRSYVIEHLGHEHAVLAIDETSFPKRGRKSAGVGWQYCGTTGQIENCQIGVFLSYITTKGHALIDRELYLPLDWCENADRRRSAHIPAEVRFQTKPELAAQMIERIQHAGIPIDWVVADTVYGSNVDLRNWLEHHHYHYVMAVACTEPVAFQTHEGRARIEACLIETRIPDQIQWQRISMCEGTKGPRLFDWAVVPLLHRWEDDGCHFLLIRRSIADPLEKCYYVVFASPFTPLSTMVAAIGCRWRIEEDFENGKDMGLDHYEVRCFLGWYRHITLVMLAAAYLAGIVATEKTQMLSAVLPPASSHAFPLIPVTIPEVRHLLGRLIWPIPRNMKRVLHWSRWRRCHQSRARYFHAKYHRDVG
ncbi:IS701 family transposase [Dictyobacter halimunensis]